MIQILDVQHNRAQLPEVTSRLVQAANVPKRCIWIGVLCQKYHGSELANT